MKNSKTVCVKVFDAPAVQYGDYVVCEQGKIEETKAELLEQMIDTIRELAKKDEFWIIKKLDANNPLNLACSFLENPYSVGWKAAFDQMAQKECNTNAATAEKKPVKIIPG